MDISNDPFLVHCVCVQSCPTLWDPMNCSLPGSFCHGITQARILECVVISYSRGSPQPRDLARISCVSCTGSQILYHCATSEDWTLPYTLLNQGRLAEVWQKLKLKQLGRSIIINHQCHIISSRIAYWHIEKAKVTLPSGILCPVRIMVTFG